MTVPGEKQAIESSAEPTESMRTKSVVGEPARFGAPTENGPAKERAAARSGALWGAALGLLTVGGLVTAQYVPATPPANPQRNEAEARVSAAERTLEGNETRLAEIETRLANLNGDVTRHVRALYRLRRAGMLPVAGGFDAMLGHLGRMERLERIVARDMEERHALEVERTRVRSQVAMAREEQDAAQQALTEAAQALPPDHGLNTFFDPNYTPRLSVVPVPSQQYGLRLRGRPERSFQSRRGDLPMPVASVSSVRDASREDGSGLEFMVPSGRSVRVVAEGTIAFARRYGVYGTMVVVDHGQSFFTVYAGLGRSDVAVGQSVHPEQTIGVTEGALYFEVRRGTRSLDPRSWVGL